MTLMKIDAWLVETLLQSISSLYGRSMFYDALLCFSLLKVWREHSTDEKQSTNSRGSHQAYGQGF